MSDFAYDRVPYQSNPYPNTHPDHLGILGRLFGLATKPIVEARVLEIGCSSGGNLLPLALAYPTGRFVGIDLAGTAIAEARATAAELGIANVELVHASVTDIDASWGEFDYIVCHGLLSWVPEPVRHAILGVFARNLAPAGVAFVSYNCLPGWRIRGLFREIMLYHSGSIADPGEKVQQSRAILDFVARATPEQNDWGELIRGEVDRIRKVSDWYLFHDNLADEMRPFWFHEVAAMAAEAGLQYLGESAFSTMILSNFGPEVAATLGGLGDIVRTEQYLDFIRNRTFRQTLLCRAENRLVRQIHPSALEPFSFTSRVRPVTEVTDVNSTEEVTFKPPDGRELATSVPLVKAMLLELGESRPVAISFDELVRRSRARIGGAPTADDREVIGQNLLTCFANDVVQPRWHLSAYVGSLSERPAAWAWARRQAARGMPYVTNMRHEGVEVDELDRHVLIMLDGTRTRDDLIRALLDEIARGDLLVRKADGEFTDPQELRVEVERSLDLSLQMLARSAVLSG